MCGMPKLLSEPMTGLQNVVDLLKRHCGFPFDQEVSPWSCPARDQTHAELQNRVNCMTAFSVSLSQRLSGANRATSQLASRSRQS
jgi:hypothetical protein